MTQRRRRRMVGSRGTVAEGGYRDNIDPEYDPEEEGLEDVNPSVEARATQREPEEEFTPSSRVESVRNRASDYEREYRLRLLHRLLMRGIPLDNIAAELNVSVSTVIRDRKLLFRRLREEASNMDANTLIGETMGFYSETQSMAMKAASMSKVPMNHRMQAIRTALSARNDRHRFLQAAGVFDVLQFKPSDNATESGIEELMRITSKLLEDDDDLDVEAKKHGVDTNEERYDEDDELHDSLRLF